MAAKQFLEHNFKGTTLLPAEPAEGLVPKGDIRNICDGGDGGGTHCNCHCHCSGKCGK
jgi:hypothetical protein